MTPEHRITAHLFNHEGSVESSTIDLVVKGVKRSVVHGRVRCPTTISASSSFNGRRPMRSGC